MSVAKDMRRNVHTGERKWWPNSVNDENDLSAIRRCWSFLIENGWRPARSLFSLTALRDNAVHDRTPLLHKPTPANIIDHADYVRSADRHAVAIVCHPYDHVDEAECVAADDAWAARRGLVFRRSTDPDASWYFPGRTRLIVLTRPDVVVQFKRIRTLDHAPRNRAQRIAAYFRRLLWRVMW